MPVTQEKDLRAHLKPQPCPMLQFHSFKAPAEDAAAYVKIMIITGVEKANCTAALPILSIEQHSQPCNHRGTKY